LSIEQNMIFAVRFCCRVVIVAVIKDVVPNMPLQISEVGSYCCYDQRRSPKHASTNIRSGQKLKEKRRPDFRYSSPAKTRLLAAVEATTLTMVLLDDLEGINSVGFSSCNMLRHKHVQVITQVFLKAYEKATTHGQDRMLVVTLARIIRRNRRLMGSSYRMGSRDFVVF
ncbi:hypothetical protein Tco_1390567, partial [Tanacetum coccineum]